MDELSTNDELVAPFAIPGGIANGATVLGGVMRIFNLLSDKVKVFIGFVMLFVLVGGGLCCARLQVFAN